MKIIIIIILKNYNLKIYPSDLISYLLTINSLYIIKQIIYLIWLFFLLGVIFRKFQTNIWLGEMLGWMDRIFFANCFFYYYVLWNL